MGRLSVLAAYVFNLIGSRFADGGTRGHYLDWKASAMRKPSTQIPIAAAWSDYIASVKSHLTHEQPFP